jgi:hypothetical protein
VVLFRQKMDPQGKIYIVKPLRESGLTGIIEIVPNSKAAVIYKVGTNLREVLASLKVIEANLGNRLKVEENKEPEGSEL